MKTFFKIRRKDGQFFRRPDSFDVEGSGYRDSRFAWNSWKHYGRFMPEKSVEIVEFRVVEVGATEIKK